MRCGPCPRSCRSPKARPSAPGRAAPAQADMRFVGFFCFLQIRPEALRLALVEHIVEHVQMRVPAASKRSPFSLAIGQAPVA